MKPSDKNKMKGQWDQVKGKVKEGAGKATGNPDLEAEGEADQIAGKVKKKVGDIQKVFDR